MTCGTGRPCVDAPKYHSCHEHRHDVGNDPFLFSSLSLSLSLLLFPPLKVAGLEAGVH